MLANLKKYKEYQSVYKQEQELKESLWDNVTAIFVKLRDLQKNFNDNLPTGHKKFFLILYGDASRLDDFYMENNALVMHYYDSCDVDDAYLNPIPFDALESDETLEKWFYSKACVFEDKCALEKAKAEEEWWEPCPNCKWFDGYDLCARSENFGAIGNESKIKCKKEQLYTPKK